jgi:hypothetical protein
LDRHLPDRAPSQATDQATQPAKLSAALGAAEFSADQLGAIGAWSEDPVERYFACITTCSLGDGECITICTEQLRESH